MATKGKVFNIARYATHDGPGIRTTVFFKGCPARCLWCCSPQSQNFETERSVDGKKVFGEDFTVEALFEKAARDAPFWRRSGGGVTLSGGEATSQPDFILDFLDVCAKNGVHTAIESCLLTPPRVVSEVARKCRLVIFDLKAVDEELHVKLTGLGNKEVLENARNILKSEKPVLARFPLVPGVNDAESNIRAVGNFLEKCRPGVAVEVLKYHRLGVGLYGELGRDYLLPDVLPPTDAEYERARNLLSEYEVKVL